MAAELQPGRMAQLSCSFCDEWSLDQSPWRPGCPFTWPGWIAHLIYRRHRDRNHRAEFLVFRRNYRRNHGR